MCGAQARSYVSLQPLTFTDCLGVLGRAWGRISSLSPAFLAMTYTSKELTNILFKKQKPQKKVTKVQQLSKVLVSKPQYLRTVMQIKPQVHTEFFSLEFTTLASWVESIQKKLIPMNATCSHTFLQSELKESDKSRHQLAGQICSLEDCCLASG